MATFTELIGSGGDTALFDGERSYQNPAVFLVTENRTTPSELLRTCHGMLVRSLRETSGAIPSNMVNTVRTLLSHPNLPVDLMDVSLFPWEDHHDHDGYWGLATNPSLPDTKARELFEKVLTEKKSPPMTAFIFRDLLSRSVFTYEDVQRAQRTLEGMLEKRDMDESRVWRIPVSSFPSFPDYLRDALVEELDPDLVHSTQDLLDLAANPTLSDEHLHRIVRDSSDKALRVLVRNTRVPESLLYTLHRYGMRRRLGYSRYSYHDNQSLFSDFSYALMNPSMSGRTVQIAYDALKRQSSYAAATARWRAAQNPNASEEIAFTEYKKRRSIIVALNHEFSPEPWDRVAEYLPETFA